MSNAIESILEQVEQALAQLLSGDVAGARDALQRLLEQARPTSGFDSPPPPTPATPLQFDAGFGDEEIDTAFDRAETRADEMRDATEVAHEAMQEAIGESTLEAGSDVFSPGEGSAYATATMAALLERQGDSEGAQAIRARLEEAEAAPRVLPEVEAMDAVPIPLASDSEPDAGTMDATRAEIIEEPVWSQPKVMDSEPAWPEPEAMDAEPVWPEPEAMDAEPVWPDPDSSASADEMDAAEAPEAAPSLLGASDQEARERQIATLERWLENLRRHTT